MTDIIVALVPTRFAGAPRCGVRSKYASLALLARLRGTREAGRGHAEQPRGSL
jgi:hypothetical protein